MAYDCCETTVAARFRKVLNSLFLVERFTVRSGLPEVFAADSLFQFCLFLPNDFSNSY